jgi:signal transduction histidine kinase
MSEHIADVFGRKYRVALAVVTALVLGNQVMVQPYLARLTTDAPLINVAGRQRMLSQRLAKAALVGQGQGERASAALGEMKEVLAAWSDAHEALRRDPLTAAVREGLDGLEPHFRAMRNAAGELIRIGEGRGDGADARAGEALEVILDHEGEYLRRMDRVVGLYEAEARGRVDRFRTVGWALTALTLAALAAIGLFIFRPAEGLIRRQVGELGRARDELEARVRERTAELESARERHRALLEQFSHAGRASTLGEMASALAHELNQPLGAIANYAEGCLLALEAPEPELGEVRDAIGRVRDAALRSGKIIERVRRFVSRQGPSREEFAPNAVVHEVVEILGADARQRGVGLALELAPGLPCLWGDPVQVQQVLVNLVRNAIESLAQAQVAEPSVVIWTGPDVRGGVEFGVTDNGEGIPADRIGQVFDAYFSTRAGGMGMGLAICRTIVEAHQGRFAVESEPGVRTTFRFFLPTDPARTDHE